MLDVHRSRIKTGETLQDAIRRISNVGTRSTHHLEGVGEGKTMVLGVGWMLSLFVVDR